MADDKEARAQALKIALEQIEKQHGKGSVMRLGEGPIQQVEVISTASISLDGALGIGGIPRGRVIEIFGPESSGKTTLCLHIIAEAQKTGGIAAFVDAEHALDIGYAKKLGVDVNGLLLSQPEFGEQALEIVETLVRSGALDVIVIDSVAALTPRAEIEGEMGDPSMGVQARLMSQALRKLTAAISKIEDIGNLHQSAPHEDRGNVWQSRNHHRRQRPEVLRLGSSGRTKDRSHQGRNEHHRQPDTCQGCQEQGCSPLPRGTVRHPL
jgi:protein RecA